MNYQSTDDKRHNNEIYKNNSQSFTHCNDCSTEFGPCYSQFENGMETSQQFPIFPIESYPISQNNGFFPSSSSPTNSVSKMMVVNQSYIPSYPQPPVKISNNSTVKNRGILKINSKDFEMAINYQCEMIINQFSTVL